MADFIGRGWAFPIRTDANGGIALVSSEREIQEAIRLIVSTSPGERPSGRGSIDDPDIDVLYTDDDPTVFYIDIQYRMKRTNDRHNLVFPFYVIPGE